MIEINFWRMCGHVWAHIWKCSMLCVCDQSPSFGQFTCRLKTALFHSLYVMNFIAQARTTVNCKCNSNNKYAYFLTDSLSLCSNSFYHNIRTKTLPTFRYNSTNLDVRSRMTCSTWAVSTSVSSKGIGWQCSRNTGMCNHYKQHWLLKQFLVIWMPCPLVACNLCCTQQSWLCSMTFYTLPITQRMENKLCVLICKYLYGMVPSHQIQDFSLVGAIKEWLAAHGES